MEKETSTTPNTTTEAKDEMLYKKNLKPFLSVFVILVILISIYYLIWRNITGKIKDTIVNKLSNYSYDSINISGFPFSKKITIKNLTVVNSMPLFSQNKIKIDSIVLSSFIFTGNLDISLKNISVLSIDNINNFILTYNEEPKFNIAFYSNGTLKSFSYDDLGYRVVNSSNNTLYTTGQSNVKLKSIKNDNTLNYALTANFLDMKNLEIIETGDVAMLQNEPANYDFLIEADYSFTEKDKEIENSVLKINNLEVKENKEIYLIVKADISSDIADPYGFGELSISIANYKNFISDYSKSLLEATQIGMENNIITKNDKTEYTKMINNLSKILLDVIKKNSATTDKLGVIMISREKGSSNYMINKENLISILEKLSL